MNPHKSNRARLGWFFLCLSILFAARLHAGPAVQVWAQRYPGASGNKIAVDKDGNVVVAAQFTYWNGAIIKYSGAGAPLWTNIWGAYGSKIQDMALDQNGNVYVTGFGEYLLMTPPDYITTAYSASGIPLWTNTYNGPASLTDEANSVAVGNDGTVYVAGYSMTTSYELQYVATCILQFEDTSLDQSIPGILVSIPGKHRG